jgi:protein-tyrosine phosphatase
VAAAHGVDLSAHRSRLLVPSDVYAADLVLVMDATQRWGIHAVFGRSDPAVLMLGDLDPLPIQTRGVEDPFGKPKDVLERSYARIERCIDEVVRAVSTARSQSGP